MTNLTPFEIDFLLSTCKENLANSTVLSELPNQRWKESHKREVAEMNTLIEKLETIKAARENSQVQNIYQIYIKGKPYRSTSNKKFFENHVQEITQAVEQGKFDPIDVYLWEVQETLFTALAER